MLYKKQKNKNYHKTFVNIIFHHFYWLCFHPNTSLDVKFGKKNFYYSQWI